MVEGAAPDDELEIAVAVEVGGRARMIEIEPFVAGPHHLVALVIEDPVAHEDLDVAVVVEVGEAEGRPEAGRLGDRLLELDHPVVADDDQLIGRGHGDDLDVAIPVDVAEGRHLREAQAEVEIPVDLTGRAIEDPQPLGCVVEPVVGHDHDVRDVAQVDRAVVVVVGQVGDERSSDRVDMEALAKPLPLDLGVEAVGRRALLTGRDRVELALLDLAAGAHARAADHVGRLAEVELGVAVPVARGGIAISVAGLGLAVAIARRRRVAVPVARRRCRAGLARLA